MNDPNGAPVSSSLAHLKPLTPEEFEKEYLMEIRARYARNKEPFIALVERCELTIVSDRPEHLCWRRILRDRVFPGIAASLGYEVINLGEISSKQVVSVEVCKPEKTEPERKSA